MTQTSLKKVLKKTLRVSLVVLVVLLVLSFLADITPIQNFLTKRFSRRIESALTHALGRSVRGINLNFTVISGVGFNLDNVYIEEAPGFGGEPFLYADHVHFVLSWRSLLMGRFELSRITLRQASLNLVRNAEGRWNFETWFFDSGPGKAASRGAGSGIPSRPPLNEAYRPLPLRIYLDGDRMNFKDLSGSYEKKVFILTEVSGKIEPAWFSNGIDFDLRMKPSRTDVPMENSGSLRLSGSLGPFHKPSFWDAAIQGQARLEKFPCSDVISLLAGKSTSLHGLFDGRASFNGSLDGPIHLSGSLDLLDLHSWAALPREQFHSASFQIPNADLRIGGPFTLSGAVLNIGTSQFKVNGGFDRFSKPQLHFMAASEKLALNDVLDVIRGFTNRIPTDTHLKGEVKVDYQLTGPWNSPVMSAQLSSSGGQIESRFLAQPATFGPLDVSLEDRVLTWDSIEFRDTEEPLFQLSGSLANLFASPQWTLDAGGHEVKLERMDEIGRSFGVWPLIPRTEGMADFSLHWGPGRKQTDRSSISGAFSGRNLTVGSGGVSDIHIGTVRFEGRNDISQLAFTRLAWGRSLGSGNLQFPGLEYRQAQVHLNANILDVGELTQLGLEARTRWLGPSSERESAGDLPASRRSELNWTGTLNSAVLSYNRLRVTNLHSDVELQRHSLLLDKFSLEAFGGRSQGHLHLDWPAGQPVLRVEGTAENMNLDTLTNLLTPLDSVVEGNVSGEYAFSGEKLKGQPWGKTISAHVRTTIRDLRNVGLRISPAAGQLRSRLNISPSAFTWDAPFTLDLDLDYTPENIKVDHAHLLRGEFKSTFSGTCSKNLELELSGTAEKAVPPRGRATTSIPFNVQGPLDRAQITFIGQLPPQ